MASKPIRKAGKRWAKQLQKMWGIKTHPRFTESKSVFEKKTGAKVDMEKGIAGQVYWEKKNPKKKLVWVNPVHHDARKSMFRGQKQALEEEAERLEKTLRSGPKTKKANKARKRLWKTRVEEAKKIQPAMEPVSTVVAHEVGHAAALEREKKDPLKKAQEEMEDMFDGKKSPVIFFSKLFKTMGKRKQITVGREFIGNVSQLEFIKRNHPELYKKNTEDYRLDFYRAVRKARNGVPNSTEDKIIARCMASFFMHYFPNPKRRNKVMREILEKQPRTADEILEIMRKHDWFPPV